MTHYGPAPRFQKRMHHVVPASWQKEFAASGNVGPYYKNVLTGKALMAEGPGQKMAEEFANIVFDEYFRASDQLEDRLGAAEDKVIVGLRRAVNTGVIDSDARVDIAYLLAIQAHRYPELFSSRLDIGRYLAIALWDLSSYTNVQSLNSHLRATGLLPGASITASEFASLKAADDKGLDQELATILEAHGYEAFFNANLVLDGAIITAAHLLSLEWDFLESPTPAFILSDRPVPTPILYGFVMALSARYALRLSKSHKPVDEKPIVARAANQAEIQSINQEMRLRAREWICGPDARVHSI